MGDGNENQYENLCMSNKAKEQIVKLWRRSTTASCGLEI